MNRFEQNGAIIVPIAGCSFYLDLVFAIKLKIVPFEDEFCFVYKSHPSNLKVEPSECGCGFSHTPFAFGFKYYSL